MSDAFGEREAPLVVGKLIGLRSFNISSTGALHPLHRFGGYTYAAGENVAKCDQATHGMLDDFDRIPSKHCSCGFYAYFRHKLGTGEVTPMAGRVLAAVEGYGRCLVGSEGFRAEKLKIIGLVLDPAPSDLATEDNPVEKVKLPFSDRFFGFGVKMGKLFKWLWSHYVILVFAITQALLTLAMITDGVSIDLGVAQLVVGGFFAALFVVGGLGVVGDYGTFVTAYFEADAIGDKKKSPAIRQTIRDKFPDVPFYETQEDLLNAIPVTNAEDVPAI